MRLLPLKSRNFKNTSHYPTEYREKKSFLSIPLYVCGTHFCAVAVAGVVTRCCSPCLCHSDFVSSHSCFHGPFLRGGRICATLPVLLLFLRRLHPPPPCTLPYLCSLECLVSSLGFGLVCPSSVILSEEQRLILLCLLTSPLK